MVSWAKMSGQKVKYGISLKRRSKVIQLRRKIEIEDPYGSISHKINKYIN